MDQELKSITIKSLIENLAINNKFLTYKDIEFLKNKFVTSSKKLKDIENQIKYEISKLEKKKAQQQRQEQHKISKAEKQEESLETIDTEYTLFNYESRGISSSKKVQIESLHLGENDLTQPRHVIVNNNFKGYLKMKDIDLVDDVDLAISQIGKLLNVDVTDIYRIEDSHHNRGILSIDILNKDIQENKTVGAIINENYRNVLTNKKYYAWAKELISLPESDKNNVIKDEISLKTLIDLGYAIIFEEYPNMTEQEKNEYKKKYFKMLVFDFLTNQLDRNSENFGISITKEGKVSLSTLYDNGCVADPENLQQDSMRFMMKICDRTGMIKILFKYYFSDIKDFVEKIVGNKYLQEKMEAIIDIYLSEDDALWYKGVVDLNLKIIKKLYIKQTADSKNKITSTGYIDTLQYSVIMVICCILLGFIIGLLFVIKTK